MANNDDGRLTAGGEVLELAHGLHGEACGLLLFAPQPGPLAERVDHHKDGAEAAAVCVDMVYRLGPLHAARFVPEEDVQVGQVEGSRALEAFAGSPAALLSAIQDRPLLD